MSSIEEDHDPDDGDCKFNFGITIPEADSAAPPACLMKKSDDSLLILHLKVPLHTNGKNVVSDATAEQSTVQHRDSGFTDAAFLSYTPDLHVPSPYEEHQSESMPGLVDEHSQQQMEGKVCHTNMPDATIGISSSKDAIGKGPLSDSLPSQASSIVCWWCCHAFDSRAFQLPLTKGMRDNKFSTVGTFCSPECAAAYNFECGSKYGSVTKQYALLHEFVSANTDKPIQKIKLAPPRETLALFGGKYDIKTFRSFTSSNDLHVSMTVAPVNPTCVTTEEIVLEQAYPIKNDTAHIPIDVDRLEKASSELRLKRKQKQKEENTLESFMQLKIAD